ncbi:MAG: co-chaperone DjlA [Candidatus Arsenophonus melophagi]|nr:co-chaperone DjlA [Candidatus Arsenophonus melophagi]
MRYWGKIIGVIFGMMSGTHILGVIIGFIIGHAYDTISEHNKLKKTRAKKSFKSLLFISIFQTLGHVTKAKGRVTEVDITLATNLMNKMQLHGDARISAQNAFREGKKKNFPLRGTLKKIRRVCFYRFDLIQMFLEIQIQAAFSDGNLHPNERKVLCIIAEELGISRNQLEQCLNIMENGRLFEHNGNYSYDSDHYRHTVQRPTLADACKVLGVHPNDKHIKIKRAYHKLMAEHHPDKLVAKGLPPEMMELAKQKTQSIQAAYNLIIKKCNFK